MRFLHVKTILLAALYLSSHSQTFAAEAEHLFTEQPTVTPELAHSGPWSVGVQTLRVTNPGQLNTTTFQGVNDRSLALEVWYPSSTDSKQSGTPAVYQDVLRSGAAFSLAGNAWRDAPLASDEQSFPLIVMSHGYTGYRSIMFYLGEHLASHGYVVASIDHTDSTNAEIDFAKNPGAGFSSTLFNRSRDQQFVLEAMLENATFKSLINPEQAAVIGYSMGGYGALNTVGGCYDFAPTTLAAMGFPEPAAASLAPLFSSCAAGRTSPDPRWKALVAFSPWGGEQNVHKAESLANLQLPALLVAGDQDDVSGFENGIEKLYKQLGSKNKYLMVYQNARHNIAAHPAPKIAYQSDLDIGHYYEPSWDSESITRINQHMTLAFLDCHVKSDKAACAFLPEREHNVQTKQADGKLSPPWPGFKDRWGAGVRFIRGNQ
ncbi:alpha/beta hydrolase family protein [Arenicella xantha]|uniref:Platelet-activating factor acetylhydrolase isoform II n=1 Tax=Arenicella xantha TaxID=644221 RepID=A0A395JQG7_9GAMM|nr:prolyl oligopeptidase family serine peptidase [Arenicella xantha]RBP52805.1 platelet-activating factor acetylhydrolase isoform II [Arenicella xantha]